MSKGIDSPTVEILNRWFEAILYFEEQVEKLNLVQLDYLERYLLQVNRKKRANLTQLENENLQLFHNVLFIFFFFTNWSLLLFFLHKVLI
jgi:hypothetical protein